TAFTWFGTAADPNANSQQPGGQQASGYSTILFYNCSSLHYTVHFWTFDLTTNEWKDHGALDAQYDADGTCPGSGTSPMQIDLADGHTYSWVVVAPDQQTCGGQNDPTLMNCVAWQGGPVVGSNKGPPLALDPFVGA